MNEQFLKSIIGSIDKQDRKLVLKTLCKIALAVGYAVAVGGFLAGFFYGTQILEHYLPLNDLLKWLKKF